MSQITEHEETIDGKSFVVYKLPPLESQDLLLDILGALGPAVGEVAGGLKGDADTPITERQVDGKALAGGLTALLAGLDKKTMREMVNTLAAVSMVDGQKLAQQFPIVFREDLSLMYRWLWFALKVQYAPFLRALQDGNSGPLGQLLHAVSSLSTSPGDGS